MTTQRPKLPPPQQPATAPAKHHAVQFGKPSSLGGHRILLYGPGGIGKTTLAAGMPGNVAFFDLDESLGRLAGLPEVAVVPVQTWSDLRAALAAPGWDSINTIVIDSVTRAEELAVTHTLDSVVQDGKHATSIEGYGFGKGFGYVFDTFLPLLGDLDRHARAGRHIILIAHDCTTTVPNPAGEDWLRWEPRLQSPGSGKASIRLRAREWCDHVLFYGYDRAIKDGKGIQSGTRTIYPTEQAWAMAKSRTCRMPVEVIETNAAEVWAKIIGGAQ